MLAYKGYIAKVELDTKAKVFHGRIFGIKDVITFEGETFAEVEREFRKSVDCYLQFCTSLGQQPERIDYEELLLKVRPFLKSKTPDAIVQAVGKAKELFVSLEEIKTYLDDEVDSIIPFLRSLNSLSQSSVLVDPSDLTKEFDYFVRSNRSMHS